MKKAKAIGRTKAAIEYAKEHPWCEACEQHATSDVHHIARRAIGDDSAANFIGLCWKCHRLYHDKGWGRFIEAYPHLEKKIKAARGEHGLSTVPYHKEEGLARYFV